MENFSDKRCMKCMAHESACSACEDYNNLLEYSIKYKAKMNLKRFLKKLKQKPKACGSCKFGFTDEFKTKCRFNPPQIYAYNMHPGGYGSTHQRVDFPITNDRSWCGRYKK